MPTNSTVVFNTTGGSGSYTWSGNTGTTGNINSSSLVTQYTSAGTENVQVSSNGQTATCQPVVVTTPICVANGNAALTANVTQNGSNYSVVLTWTSTGNDNQLDLAKSTQSNIITSGGASGTYTDSNVSAGSTVNYLLIDANCNSVIASATVVIPAAQTTGNINQTNNNNQNSSGNNSPNQNNNTTSTAAAIR